MKLQLQIRSWGEDKNTVKFFDTEERALQHLTDHLLTAPECEIWSLLQPSYWEIVGHPQRYIDRHRYLQSVVNGDTSPQPLYELYVSATHQELLQAHELCWYLEADGYLYAFGTSAIFIVLERIGERQYRLKTAYIPAQGSPEKTTLAKSRRLGWTEITRDSTRTNHTLTLDHAGSYVKLERTEKKHDRHSRKEEPGSTRFRGSRVCPAHTIPANNQEEALYYLGFREAVQFMRSRRYDNAPRSPHSPESWSDIHRLSDKLPPMSQLSLAEWKRRRAGLLHSVGSLQK